MRSWENGKRNLKFLSEILVSFDQRNERGDTLLNFLQQHDLFAMNSFFSGKIMLNTRFQRSKLVKKRDMIDVQRLYELSEKFKTQMNVE